MELITKKVFLDMLEKSYLTPKDKQWSITKNRKRYVSTDVFEKYKREQLQNK